MMVRCERHGGCEDEYTLTRTWTAEDNCGNTSSCSQVITVEDNTAPVITCPVDETVECDAYHLWEQQQQLIIVI